MNATECCHTIGCNCGGTRMAELFARTDLIIAMVVTAIAFLIVVYSIIKYYTNKNESRKRAS